MTILRQAFGLETRSDPPPQVDLAAAFPGDVTGTVAWQAGMVWNGRPPGAYNVDAAMRLSAVFACLRLISEAIATLPLDTFRRGGGTRRPHRPRPTYLTFDPPQESRVDYLSQLVLSLLTDGNAYVLTPRDRFGEPVDLIVLDPAAITVQRKRGRVLYRALEVDLGPGDLLHIKGMTLPGHLTGVSPIAYARETIGIGLAAQTYGKALLDNGAVPSAAIEIPASGSAQDTGEAARDKAQRIAATWNSTHQGAANAGRIGVLLGGATLNTYSINPDDAQYLETRQFQVPDIARIFGVPPHLIADASNSTSWGSGLAEQNLAFGQFSLRPWLERIETAHSRLLTTHGLPDVFVRLNLDALLRASLSDRYASYAIGIESRFLRRNEARALEDLPPIPGGDDFPDPPAGGVQ